MIDAIFQSSGEYQLAQKMLDAAALRQNAIAENIANAETPGYHRMDVSADFEARLKESLETGSLPAVAASIQPTLSEDPNARSVRPDGNNVDMDKELLAMNSNSIQYEYLTDVVSYNIKQIRMAVSGQVGAAS